MTKALPGKKENHKKVGIEKQTTIRKSLRNTKLFIEN